MSKGQQKSPAQQGSFKGNKSYLPSKPCVVCKKEMTWRKSWARNWDEVKYCSDACRKAASKTGRT